MPYPRDKAPSQRLKFEQYYSHFEEAGFEVHTSSFVGETFWKVIYQKGHWIHKFFYTCAGYFKRMKDIFRLAEYDVVYVHLWVTPFGIPFFEWLICRLSRRVIYDIDDLVYLAESKSAVNKLIAGIKGKGKPIYLMKNADHVITCTPYLDQFVRQYNLQTTDISSTINTEKYHPKSDYSIVNRPVILGWSGSHSTSKYLYLLEPVFRKLQQEGIAFRLLIMGDADFKIEGIATEALSWEDSYETEVIGRFDIGLYPLPDEQWVYGKSGLKALQYMAAGVPTIATAIGTNFRIMEHGKTGFLAKEEKDWLKYIKLLIIDGQLRQRMGAAGASMVEEKFSIHANKDTYLHIVQQVAPAARTSHF